MRKRWFSGLYTEGEARGVQSLIKTTDSEQHYTDLYHGSNTDQRSLQWESPPIIHAR